MVIGLSEANGEFSLLTEDFTAPPELLEGSVEEHLCQLLLHLEIIHNHIKIQKINYINKI